MGERTCSAPDCEKPSGSHKLCAMHRNRWRRHGSYELPVQPPQPPLGICPIPGCETRLVRGRQLCGMHRARYRRNGHYDKVRRRNPKRVRICIVEGCSMHAGGRMCSTHYLRLKNTGTTDLPPPRPPSAWDQGNGYLMTVDHACPIANRAGRVYVHRRALFDAIGLGPHECHWCHCHVNWFAGLHVDHVDTDRRNNAATNLVPSCQPCNARRTNRWTKRHAA